MKIFHFFVCVLILWGTSYSDNCYANDDSWNDANLHDTTKINLILEKGNQMQKVSIDSALFYYNMALEKAVNNNKKLKRFIEQEAEALRLVGNLNWQSGNNTDAIHKYNRVIEIFIELEDMIQLADAYNMLGMIYASNGLFFEGKQNFEKFLDVGVRLNDNSIISRAHNNIGLVYWNIGIYDKALESFMLALKINEELGNKDILAGNYNNIGNIHKHQNNFDKALEYYYKSLDLAIELGKKQQQAGCYNNIGATLIGMVKVENDIVNNISNFHEYSDFKNIDNAIDYYHKALNISKELKDSRTMSMCYNNIGAALNIKGRLIKNKQDKLKLFNDAIENFKMSLDIKEILGDKNGMSMNTENIAVLNLDIANAFKNNKEMYVKHLNIALDYALMSMSLANQINSISRQSIAAKALMNTYKALGNCNKALDYAEIYLITRDSLFNEEKTKAITEVETKYETEQKQQEINNQKLKIEKQEIENKRQITVRNFLIAGTGLLTLLVFFIFIGYRQKQRSNYLIKEKNAQLEQANEEIRSQKEEIETQHIVVVDHKNLIEAQKKRMDDSILYARHIQSAVLLSQTKAESLLGQYFIIFRPKEVVSGDFYWAAKVNDSLVVAVADCTGHGVSGAFMSILGVSLLNEIVIRKQIVNPAEILEGLRFSLIEALAQNNEQDMQREGMNISIISINNDYGNCFWAGARNPLWIIRDGADYIEEFKPDNTSVALHAKLNKFTNNKISINIGDIIYMFSDGIVDQFGGSEGKKFSSARLKQLLIQNASKPLHEQKLIVDQALDNWQNPENSEIYEQIDDITLIGLKLV